MTRPRDRKLGIFRVEFHDDPACPATVHFGRYSATFGCAIETGELECGECQLTRKQLAFLETLTDEEAAWNDYLRKDHPEYA